MMILGKGKVRLAYVGNTAAKIIESYKLINSFTAILSPVRTEVDNVRLQVEKFVPRQSGNCDLEIANVRNYNQKVRAPTQTIVVFCAISLTDSQQANT